MKIKIQEPGLSYFTGVLSGVAFKDGVSISELSPAQIDSIGASMRCVEIDGEQVGPVSKLNSFSGTTASEVTKNDPKKPTKIELEAAQKVADENELSQQSTKAPKHTKESLGKLADEKGIAGLRSLANELGVKGTSIKKLIEAILTEQGRDGK